MTLRMKLATKKPPDFKHDLRKSEKCFYELLGRES